MRRGFVRLRFRSAHHRGLIHLGYLRELGFVTLLIGSVLAAQQAFRAPAAPTVQNRHAEHPVYGLALSDAGKTLWVAREHYGISHMDLSEGTERDRWKLFQAEASFAAHGGGTPALTLRYGVDRLIELLRGNDTIHSETLNREFAIVSDTDVSADGRVAVLVNSLGKMKVWKVGDAGTVEAHIETVLDQADHIVLHRDGTMAAIVNWERVELWNFDEARVVSSWKLTHGAAPGLRDYRADTVALSPDGTRLALGFGGGMVRVWNTADQTLVWEHQADQFKATAVAFSECGTKLATGGFDNHLRLWDLLGKELIWVRKGHDRSIHNLVFAADDTRLYSGGLDGKVCEWSLRDGQPLRELP